MVRSIPFLLFLPLNLYVLCVVVSIDADKGEGYFSKEQKTKIQNQRKEKTSDKISLSDFLLSLKRRSYTKAVIFYSALHLPFGAIHLSTNIQIPSMASVSAIGTQLLKRTRSLLFVL